MGDPAGCGPQISIETWTKRNQLDLPPFFVIGDPRLYAKHVPIQTLNSAREAIEVFENALPVLPMDFEGADEIIPGQPNSILAPAIIESISHATALCLDGTAAGIVTNPISKAVLYEAGFKFPGHTEFIADLCAAENVVPKPIMMLVGGGLRVALATIHVPLMKVSEYLTPAALSEVAQITHNTLIRDFGITKPRLAFTGLNPHAGEDGNIGTEERDIINPVAAALRQTGVEISDARPADTVFHEALSGAYDAVIAMTHDQGLIPVKTLDIWGGVNTTLGLPIIRTSPDHGTAYDAAAAGTCRPDSLIAALKLANELAKNRAQAND